MKKIIASLRDSIRSLCQEADCNPIATDDGKNTLSGPHPFSINEYMKKKYFEIYVGGSHGFSAYVSTDKLTGKPGEDIEGEILALAVAAKVIEQGDAKEVYNGAGYVEERKFSELHPKTIITEI